MLAQEDISNVHFIVFQKSKEWHGKIYQSRDNSNEKFQFKMRFWGTFVNSGFEK